MRIFFLTAGLRALSSELLSAFALWHEMISNLSSLIGLHMVFIHHKVGYVLTSALLAFIG